MLSSAGLQSSDPLYLVWITLLSRYHEARIFLTRSFCGVHSGFWFLAAYADTVKRKSLFLELRKYLSNDNSMQTEMHGNVKTLCKLKSHVLNKCRHANLASVQGAR